LFIQQIQIARLYLRCSNEDEDLARQAEIVRNAHQAGYYITDVYRERAAGGRTDHPELLRMIADLQPGDVVVAEKIDRLSRLTLPEAERLVASIRAKGARLAVPGVVDFTDLAKATDAATSILLETAQELLLKVALQIARDGDEARRDRQSQGGRLVKTGPLFTRRVHDTATHERIVALRASGGTIKHTAELAGCSATLVKRVWALHLKQSVATIPVDLPTTAPPDIPSPDDSNLYRHSWPDRAGTKQR